MRMNKRICLPSMIEVRLIGGIPALMSSAFLSYILEANTGMKRPYSSDIGQGFLDLQGNEHTP